jgi:chloramphenicol O-acetyltransferase
MPAADVIEGFRLRLREHRVWCIDAVGIGYTLLRADRTFGFT